MPKSGQALNSPLAPISWVCGLLGTPCTFRLVCSGSVDGSSQALRFASGLSWGDELLEPLTPSAWYVAPPAGPGFRCNSSALGPYTRCLLLLWCGSQPPLQSSFPFAPQVQFFRLHLPGLAPLSLLQGLSLPAEKYQCGSQPWDGGAHGSTKHPNPHLRPTVATAFP